jgi:hypothetical protein
MPALRFGGEGKWRVEWGVKRGESAVPFFGKGGVIGAVTARAGGGGGGGRSASEGRR